MPFRSLVAAPEQLVAITSAFDSAWNELSARGPYFTKIRQNRTWLAHIVLHLAQQERANLAEAAVERFLATVPMVEHPPGRMVLDRSTPDFISPYRGATAAPAESNRCCFG